MLTDRKTGTPSLAIIFRCYNEGVAFRYHVPVTDSSQTTVISKELTSFSLTGPVNVWASHSAQGTIYKTTVDSIRGSFERPLLVEQDTATWVALGDRKSVVTGKSGSGRVDLGGSRIIKQTKKRNTLHNTKIYIIID